MDVPKLQIDCTESNGILVIRVAGDAGVASSGKLDRELMLASAGRHLSVVLDLSELTFISSISMGLLVAFHHGVIRNGGRCRVAGLQRRVAEAFERARLTQILSICPTVHEAMTSEQQNEGGPTDQTALAGDSQG
jgi:anti-anti-sigma factor